MSWDRKTWIKATMGERGDGVCVCGEQQESVFPTEDAGGGANMITAS